jgi:hypothetical protein
MGTFMMKKDLASMGAKKSEATDAEVEQDEVASEPTGMKGKPQGKEQLSFALTAADKEKVRLKAAKIVADKHKKLAEEKLLAQYVKELEQELIPEQQLEPILINVAGHADKIVLDGKQFQHGHVYHLTANERETLEDIMAQTWRHEREVGGANFNHYRKPANAILRPGAEIMPLSALVQV